MTTPGSHASALERLSDYLDGLPVRAYADGACTPVADLAIIARALAATPTGAGVVGALTAWAARHDLVGTGWHAILLADLGATVTALVEAERERAREIITRLTMALEQHLPPDPHHHVGGGHVCDVECEEMVHLGQLLADARHALRQAPRP